MCNRGSFGGCGCGYQGNRGYECYHTGCGQTRGTLFIGYGQAYEPVRERSSQSGCNCGCSTVNVLPAYGCGCTNGGSGYGYNASWNGWNGSTWCGGCL